jgi:[ribosomal protein S18]-alanine N-acetyltransferase
MTSLLMQAHREKIYNRWRMEVLTCLPVLCCRSDTSLTYCPPGGHRKNEHRLGICVLRSRIAFKGPRKMTQAAFHIRRARLSDLASLLALERRAFTTDHLSARQYRRHIGSDSALVLAAVNATRLLGKAVVFFRRSSPIARLYSIAVADDARGLGLGKALLAAAENHARRRGSREMRLEVRKGNRAAIRLYERLGYRRFGSYPRFYEDGADAWRYAKDLERAL